MKTSEQINELAAALAKASMEFPAIPRNCRMRIPAKEGKSGREYSYADLDDVLSAVRVPLAKNGLVLTFDCRVSDQPFVAFITARLCHSSGQWKESEPLPIPCEGYMSAAQQIGSANTYGKRYTAQNMLGISTEADDDGAGAGGIEVAEGGRKAPSPNCPKCGKNEFVLADREVAGRWFCWKNSEKKKLGCGHKWDADLTEQQPKGESPKNGRAQELAEQHGMTTGDKLDTTHTPTYEKLVESLKGIDASAQNASNRLTKAEDFIYSEWKNRHAITDAEKQGLDFMVAEIQKEIEGHRALDKQAANAAA